MIPLDDIDRSLIDALQRDGRASYADLADLVGLSPAATRLRVQRLLDAEVVQVDGDHPPATCGEPLGDCATDAASSTGDQGNGLVAHGCQARFSGSELPPSITRS